MDVIGHDYESVQEKRSAFLHTVNMFDCFPRERIILEIGIPRMGDGGDQHGLVALDGMSLRHTDSFLSRNVAG